MSETSTFRILLIAEDPLIGSILRDQLQSLSHSVSLHASAGEGLADAQQQSFPLVIVDDQIAGNDSTKLLQELARTLQFWASLDLHTQVQQLHLFLSTRLVS